MKELKQQINRLQDKNKLLHEQMADVEETNNALKTENSKLEAKVLKYVEKLVGTD